MMIIEEVGQFVEEVDGGSHPSKEVVKIDKLIRRVRVLIRESETEQHGVQSKQLFELHNDRYGTSFTLVQWFLSESFLQCNSGSTNARAVDRGDRSLASMKITHSNPYSV